MEAKKPQNSILIVATLGVYLGLMLAGAAPQVLANAALTKQFNVRDEIELNDDLDNKPDDSRSPVDLSLNLYIEEVRSTILWLETLRAKGSFDFSKDTFDVEQSVVLPCLNANIAGRYTAIRFDSTSESAKRALKHLSSGMSYGYSLGDCVESEFFPAHKAVYNRFDFHYDGKAFWSNLRLKRGSGENASDLVKELNYWLKFFETANLALGRTEIVRNTTFTAANDQVTIVTRLPRGSLDTLLALSAK